MGEEHVTSRSPSQQDIIVIMPCPHISLILYKIAAVPAHFLPYFQASGNLFFVQVSTTAAGNSPIKKEKLHAAVP
jgi:hypothetical protein